MRNFLRDLVMARLEAPRRNYERRIYNDMEHLLRSAQPGNRARPFRQGCPASRGGSLCGGRGDRRALRKYQEDNIRLCRPYGISEEDRDQVIDGVVANLGKHYDEQNIIDLALMLLPLGLNPFKKKTIKACLGGCNDFRAICSGMIARSFQKVGYPIVPAPQSRLGKDTAPTILTAADWRCAISRRSCQAILTSAPILRSSSSTSSASRSTTGRSGWTPIYKLSSRITLCPQPWSAF